MQNCVCSPPLRPLLYPNVASPCPGEGLSPAALAGRLAGRCSSAPGPGRGRARPEPAGTRPCSTVGPDVTCSSELHSWLFTFKYVKMHYNEEVSQPHQPYFRCSGATRGSRLPHWAGQCLSVHKASWTELSLLAVSPVSVSSRSICPPCAQLSRPEGQGFSLHLTLHQPFVCKWGPGLSATQAFGGRPRFSQRLSRPRTSPSRPRLTRANASSPSRAMRMPVSRMQHPLKGRDESSPSYSV